MFKKSQISGIFGQSPVRPLQKHMAVVVKCSEQLGPFVELALKQDWDGAGKVRNRIAALENEADALKHELRLALPRSIFMPVPREDILQILTAQDKVANKVKDIAGLILGRKMKLPKPLFESYRKLVVRSHRAVLQADKTVNELDELVETGFAGSPLEVADNLIAKLDRIEKETDELQIEVRGQLFRIEKDLPPLECMFLYQVIEKTGELGDQAQRVGSRLQLLLAR